MIEEMEIFAEKLKTFFYLFDITFLEDEQAEDLLAQGQKSLKEKILHNETLLPVIYALGREYNSDVDKAKVDEIDALLALIKARKKLKNVTLAENQRKEKNQGILAGVFGLVEEE